MVNKDNRDGSPSALQALYSRCIYDAYYLAQGLLGGRVKSLDAVEQAFRRCREKLEPLTEEEQDNLLLQQVTDVCRERADTAVLEEESGADYIAFMSMPFRARQVLVLADVLHLPDRIIAPIMHSRRDRVLRSLKEAREDLTARAATSLKRHETAAHIMERNVHPLTQKAVEELWTRLGGSAEQMAQWQEPNMQVRQRTWPLVVGLAAAGAVLMAMVVMLASGFTLKNPNQTTYEAQVLPGLQSGTTTTRIPSTLTTTAASTAPMNTVVITLGGDTVLGGLPSRADRRDSFPRTTGNESTYPFAGLLPVLSRDDLTVLNLECALTERTAAVDGQDYPFRGRPDAANMLVAGSVEAVSLENSHSMDYGEEGYEDTKQALEGAGVLWADGETAIVRDTAAGVRIGLAALKDPVTSEGLQQAIRELQDREADFIILSLHWGEELAQTPSQQQQTLAREAIDLGADVIMGHHAHVVQTMEVYKDRPIFYSLGNAVYGGSSDPSDWDIALARITLTCQEGEVVDVAWMAIPGCVSGSDDRNDYQPRVYEPGTADAIRVYGKLGMSHAQLGEWKRLYDELYPAQQETTTTPKTEQEG